MPALPVLNAQPQRVADLEAVHSAVRDRGCAPNPIGAKVAHDAHGFDFVCHWILQCMTIGRALRPSRLLWNTADAVRASLYGASEDFKYRRRQPYMTSNQEVRRADPHVGQDTGSSVMLRQT